MVDSEKQEDQPMSSKSLTSQRDVNSESPDLNKWKDGAADDVLRQRTAGARKDSIPEPIMPYINDNDENTRLIPNGDAAIANNTPPASPEFPFSTARVWVACTLIMVIYIVVLISLGPLTSQYIFHRFAQDHNNLTTNSTNNKGTCSNSTGGGADSMNKAQKEASKTIQYASIAGSIPAIFVCLFAGSVSDFLGRKFLLLFSLSGALVKNVILCLIIKFDLDIQLLYVGSAADGIVGSMFVTTLAVTAIVTDITSEVQSKAVRFAIIEGIILVCGALSQLAVGYMIQAVGFLLPVLMCACLLFFSLLIAIFLLPETLRMKQKITWNMKTHIKKTFIFYFSDGSGKSRRLQFIVGLATHLTLTFINVGKSVIETLYMLNVPICWNSVDIGIFSAIRMVIMSLAAVFVLKMSKNRLSLEVTGMICGISSAAGFMVEGFADSTLLMYLSSLVGILFTAVMPIPRTIMSHIAPTNDQGALFSGMSCVEAVGTLVSATAYTLVYNATLDTFRGAAFIIMASMCLLNIFFLGTFRFLRLSKQNSYEYLVTDSGKTEDGYTILSDVTEEPRNTSENRRNLVC